MKKIISVAMSICILITILCVPVYATEVPVDPLTDAQMQEMVMAADDVSEAFSAIGFTKQQFDEILALENYEPSFLGTVTNREFADKAAWDKYNEYYQTQKDLLLQQRNAQRGILDWTPPLNSEEQANWTMRASKIAYQEYSNSSYGSSDEFACYIYMAEHLDKQQFDRNNPNYDIVHSRYICENDVQIFKSFMNVTKYINSFRHMKNFAESFYNTVSLGKEAYDGVKGDAQSAILFSYDIADGLNKCNVAPDELGEVTADMVTAIERNRKKAFNVNDLANLINEEREMYSETFQKLDEATIGRFVFDIFSAKTACSAFITASIGAVSLWVDLYNQTLDYGAAASLRLSFGQRVAERLMIELGMAPHL